MWFDNPYSISLKRKSCEAVYYLSMKLYTGNSAVWLCEGSITRYTTNFIEQNQTTKSSSKKQSTKHGPKPDLKKLSSPEVFTNIKHFSSHKLQSYFNCNCSVIHANQLWVISRESWRKKWLLVYAFTELHEMQKVNIVPTVKTSLYV